MRPSPARDPRQAAIAAVLLAAIVSISSCASGGSAGKMDVEREIEFGLRSARAGLWNEALYRFERAAAVRPDDAALRNNLAVAYEHEGRYDDAAREYERASEIAPGDEHIRKNVEAFKAFRAGKEIRDDDAGDAPPGDGGAPPPADAAAGGGKEPDVS